MKSGQLGPNPLGGVGLFSSAVVKLGPLALRDNGPCLRSPRWRIQTCTLVMTDQTRMANRPSEACHWSCHTVSTVSRVSAPHSVSGHDG